MVWAVSSAQSALARVARVRPLGVVAATGGIFFVYLIGFLLSLLGLRPVLLNETGWVGIGISGVTADQDAMIAQAGADALPSILGQ